VEDFLHYGIQITLCLAHFVDDSISLVLDFHGIRKIVLTNQLIHGYEQLRHNRIGSTDSAVSTDSASGNKLLIGAVEHYESIFATLMYTLCLEQLDILSGHGRVLNSDNVGVFQHFF